MHHLLFWAIGWISFVLMATDAFQPKKQPEKKALLHFWLVPNVVSAQRGQHVRSVSGLHQCFSPAV